MCSGPGWAGVVATVAGGARRGPDHSGWAELEGAAEAGLGWSWGPMGFRLPGLALAGWVALVQGLFVDGKSLPVAAP